MKEPIFRTVTEIETFLAGYMPGAVICEGDEGQLVIYTNLYEKDDGTLDNWSDLIPTDFGQQIAARG